MSFDMNPADEDEHGECRYEIERLNAELATAWWIMRRAKATCSPATGDLIDDWLSRNKEQTDA